MEASSVFAVNLDIRGGGDFHFGGGCISHFAPLDAAQQARFGDDAHIGAAIGDDNGLFGVDGEVDQLVEIGAVIGARCAVERFARVAVQRFHDGMRLDQLELGNACTNSRT